MEILVALLGAFLMGMLTIRIAGVGLTDGPAVRTHVQDRRTLRPLAAVGRRPPVAELPEDRRKASGKLLIVLILSGAGLAAAIVVIFRWLGMILAKVVS